MEIEQSVPINEKSDKEIMKENEETKEKKRQRNREYQRAWRKRQEALKKKVSKEEKEEKRRKRHRENQKAYYYRKKASTMAESQNSMPYPVAIIVNVDVNHHNCSQISTSIATTNSMRVNISAEHPRNYIAQKKHETQAASDLPSIHLGYPKTAAERMREYRAQNKKETPIVNQRKYRKSDVERAKEYRARRKAKNQSAGIRNKTRISGEGIVEPSSSKLDTSGQKRKINNEKLFLDNSDSDILQRKDKKKVVEVIIGKPSCPKKEIVCLEQEMVCLEQETVYPEQEVVYPKQEMVYPEQEMVCPKQETDYPEQEMVCPKQEMVCPEQEMVFPKQEKVYAEQEIVYPEQEMIFPKQEIVCPKEENPSEVVTFDDWGNNCTHSVKIENMDDPFIIEVPTFK